LPHWGLKPRFTVHARAHRLDSARLVLARITARLAATRAHQRLPGVHSDRRSPRPTPPARVSLFVDEVRSRRLSTARIPAQVARGITSKHPDDNVPAQPPSCVKCHAQKARLHHQCPWRESCAGRDRRRNCWMPRLARHALGQKSRVACLQTDLPGTCAKCHSTRLTEEYQMKIPGGAQYMDSIHGRALLKMGLIVAPSCNDATAFMTSSRQYASFQLTTQCRQNLRQMPLGIERSTIRVSTASSWPKRQRDRFARIATPPRSRDSQERHFRWPATSAAGDAIKTLEHYRDTYHGKAMALASRTLPRMSPPATTATAITTCCALNPPRGSPGQHLATVSNVIPKRRSVHRI